jgi:two-component system response regulator LytT
MGSKNQHTQITEQIRILIVEDEPPTARYIERCCRAILGDRIRTLETCFSLKGAAASIAHKPIDLCLLDLNLKGENGYDLLRAVSACSFHTIIISAHTEQAVEAFQFGVLDFIPKPFEQEDLRSALHRYFNRIAENRRIETRYLTTRHGKKNIVFPVDSVLYFKAADVYVETHLRDGKVELLSKSMDKLQQLLPLRFFRIHRSYFVNISEIQSYTPVIDGSCQVVLKNGETLPLSRRRRKDLEQILNLS